MIAARRETSATIVPPCVSRDDRLDAVMAAVQTAQPHLDGHPEVDGLVVVTGERGWTGPVRPHGVPLVVVAPNATEPEFIAQDDPSMLQVVGFDASVPRAITQFVSGAAV
jgi:hypothetical protein